jgi:MFS family permease
MLTHRPPRADASPDELMPESVDARSLTGALSGTFVLRCASQGAGFLVAFLLGLHSRGHEDFTSFTASLVFVCFFAAELLSAPVFGALSDRLGRKPIMLLGALFGAVAAQLLSLAALLPAVVLIRVLQGLSTGASAPATLGFLSAETARAPTLRGRVMGFYEAATVVGLASGAALAGRAHDRLGDATFTLLAGLYLVALLLFLLVRDRPSATGPRVQHGGLLQRLLNRRIMRFAPAWLAANAVLGAWFAQAPFLAARERNPDQLLMGSFGAGQIGMAFFVFGVVFTVGAVVWGFLMPRLGRQATLLIGVAGLAFATGVLWLLNHAVDADGALVPVLVVLALVGLFVESGFTPAALAYLAEIAEEQPEDRGSVMGIYSVLLSVGQVLGGAVAAPFAEHLGFNGLIILTGLLCLVAAGTVLALAESERRHLASKLSGTAEVA